jgi:urease accessory protein
MIGQQSRRISLVALFLATLLAGILVIMFATFPLDMIPTILLACGAAAGLLTALGRSLPWPIPAAILAAGAMALIVDSVPSVISKSETILALGGTTLTATLTLALIVCAAAALTRDWQRTGVRIVGSWTAASALLVLALQLTR